MRVLVDLPKRMVGELDDLADELSQSRAKLVRTLLRLSLDEIDEEEPEGGEAGEGEPEKGEGEEEGGEV